MRLKVVPPPTIVLFGGGFHGNRISFPYSSMAIGGELYSVRKLTEYRNAGDAVEKRIARIALHQSIVHDRFRAMRSDCASMLEESDWTPWHRIPGARIEASR